MGQSASIRGQSPRGRSQKAPILSAGLTNGPFPERPSGQGEPLWKKLAFAAEFAANTTPADNPLRALCVLCGPANSCSPVPKAFVFIRGSSLCSLRALWSFYFVCIRGQFFRPFQLTFAPKSCIISKMGRLAYLKPTIEDPPQADAQN